MWLPTAHEGCTHFRSARRAFRVATWLHLANARAQQLKAIMRAAFLTFLVACGSSFAGPAVPAEEACCELNLWTGEGVSIGNWLLPEINYQAVAGSSTTNPARLAVGHHDPDRHGITQQALEFSLTARLNSNISLFGTYSAKIDQSDHWVDEFEEFYAIFDNLPGDLRIRAGRLQPRLGYQNERHIHDFDFVDQYLASARMYGEDPLVIYGGEVSVPVLRRLPKGWDDRLTVSFGSIPEPDEEEHLEFGPETPFEAEGNLFADWAATFNYRLGYAASPSTRYELGIAGAVGKNEFGRHSQVYGLHFQYEWKPPHEDHKGHVRHGHHHHGESAEFLRWRTEIFARHFGAVGEVEEEVSEMFVIPAQPEVRTTVREVVGVISSPGGAIIPVFRDREVVVREARPKTTIQVEGEPQQKSVRDEFMDMGFYSTLSYGFPSGRLQAHLRAEYVSGVSEAGLPERWRISPVLAWRPTARLPIHFKLQYNYDHSPAFGDEHSVWAQFNLSWGDCCAHH